MFQRRAVSYKKSEVTGGTPTVPQSLKLSPSKFTIPALTLVQCCCFSSLESNDLQHGRQLYQFCQSIPHIAHMQYEKKSPQASTHDATPKITVKCATWNGCIGILHPHACMSC